MTCAAGAAAPVPVTLARRVVRSGLALAAVGCAGAAVAPTPTPDAGAVTAWVL